MRCAEARRRLQDLHDEGGAPGKALAAHLAGCAGCRAFHEFLADLGGRMREALDADASILPRPDYPSVFARPAEARERTAFGARRLRPALVAAAAMLVAVGGIAAGVSTYLGGRERNRVADQVSVFVEELFARPLLADNGFPVDVPVTGFRDWLEDPGPSSLP